MTYALGTSRGVITKAPLLLIDLETEEGVTGRAYLWCYFPAAMPAIAKILEEVARVVKGERVAPVDLWARLAERFALIGVQGIVRMAMSGFDMAAWDALAQAAGLRLAALLGSDPKRIPAYNSCGLGLMKSPGDVADEAAKLLFGGFRAIKLRLGYPTLQEDLAALHAVKKRVGDAIAVMVDYNQALSLVAALERGRALDQEGIYWLEEPIRHDDYAGYATLVRELKTPIQIGENFSESSAMATALAAGAADYVMPDLERIGGVTGWQRAAALAATQRIAMSSHLFPEVSVHLLSATPTCHFLEYVDWADKILEQPLEIDDGFAVVPQRPGNGLTWDKKAVEKYRDRVNISNLHPSRRRLLAGMDGAALFAFARLLVGIERLVERRQVLHEVRDLHLDAMHQRAACEAIPFEGIECVGPCGLHHQADRAFLRPLRRVGHVRRKQEYLALADRHVVEIAVVHDLEHHVALELVEEFLDRIVVIVRALVRPADDLHGHVAVLEHLLVADRRLQQVLVLLDPALEVEGVQSSGCHGCLLQMTLCPGRGAA